MSVRNPTGKTPYSPQQYSFWRVLFFQFFSIVFIFVGLSYLSWRWTSSLNPNALWFSIPLVLAETMIFISSLLLIVNYWRSLKIKQKRPVKLLSQIEEGISPAEDRPIKIDIFITTYNEELEVVEPTVVFAKKLEYPFEEVDIQIYLCDDGRRNGSDPDKENFKALAEKHRINYLTRPDNTGFKAGNLNHSFWQTDGDLIVILDADTLVLPKFLIHLTGYFRTVKMAWVQSPQWFYDISEGRTLAEITKLHFFNYIPLLNRYKVGKNILGTDPQIFYDGILRHRNSANAAFCCGAGSIHRRAALEGIIKNKQDRLVELKSVLPYDTDLIKNKSLYDQLNQEGKIVGPFVHHISEDLYTSVLIHSEKEGWRSYQHPDIECMMLSPQDISGVVKQYSRYAEGTYQLFFSRDNPLFIKGLSIRQRLGYLETIYSYFTALWVFIFLVSPIVFFFTLTPPVQAFNFDFFLRFLIFIFMNTMVASIANWGISIKRSEQYYISGFWYKLMSFIKILTGKKMVFNTTRKKTVKSNVLNNLKHTYPHIIITFLTVAGFVWNIYLVQQGTHPSYSAFFANSMWALYNIYHLNPIIRATFITPTDE
nr:glycosyltransferase [Saprospiraceae bacterium]